jgi:hypothetical protein
MKIAFLGASVTAQTFAHQSGELTGYVEAFKKHHATHCGFSEVLSYAWSGNRLSDAGMVCIHLMLQDKPDVAILEPLIEDHTRGRDFSPKHIEYFFYSCTTSGILPIVFALPKPGGLAPFNHLNYDLLNSYCKDRNLPIIPIIMPNQFDRDLFYRDTVHTRKLGAEYYAQSLANALPAIVSKGLQDIDSSGCVSTLKVNCIQSDPKSKIHSVVIRNLDPQSSNGYFLLLQKQKIGDFSPVIETSFQWLSGNHSSYNSSIWDPYCYYERLSYVTLAESDRSDFVSIGISVANIDPQYENCRGKFDYSKCKFDRFICPAGPFWIISDQTLDIVIETI